MSDHLKYCSVELSDKEETRVIAYLSSLVFEATYELPEFPDIAMDWACSTVADMRGKVGKIIGKGGKISWIGPGSSVREIHAHRAFREEIRQRLIRRMSREDL